MCLKYCDLKKQYSNNRPNSISLSLQFDALV